MMQDQLLQNKIEITSFRSIFISNYQTETKSETESKINLINLPDILPIFP